MSGLSLVIPMYNEEGGIRHVIEVATESLERTCSDHQIVIVNDCSTDDSGRIADELAAADERIQVIHNEKNVKLGRSLRAGFQAATKDFVLYSDADLPFDFEEIGRALRILSLTGADIVSAFRIDRTSEGTLRSFYSFVYNLVIRVAFGLRVKDVNFSFKLMRRAVLETIELKSEGSFIDAELLLRARKANFHIVQMGVDYFPRIHGTSTLARPSVIVKLVKELVELGGQIGRVS